MNPMVMVIGQILLLALQNGPAIIESLRKIGTEDADTLIKEIEAAQEVWKEWT